MPLPAFNYGSDDSGLACGFLIGDGARTETIGAADALARLRQPASVPAPRQFVWLPANLSKAASERWLRSHARVDTTEDQLLAGRLTRKREHLGALRGCWQGCIGRASRHRAVMRPLYS